MLKLNVGGSKITGWLPNALVTTRGKKGAKTLYLTFDDGPDPDYSLKVCDLLDQYSAKATFFCIGQKLLTHVDIAKQLVSRGHLLANHSHRHREFFKRPLSTQIEEIENCHFEIEKVSPGSLKLFRAPEGKLNISLLIRLKLKGWNVVHWSFDSMDYKKMSLQDQLAFFEKNPVSDGEILLFHDDAQLAIEILTEMLPKWKKAGYQFKSVESLFRNQQD